MSEPLRVGVFDWPEFAPGNDFYPPDLPPEWRLNYYANAFETACLPLSVLPREPEQRQEWLDSLPEGFRLGLLLETPADGQALPQPDELGGARPGWLVGETGGCDHPAWAGYLPTDRLWRPGNADFAPVALLPAADSISRTRQWIESWVSLSEDPEALDSLWVAGGSVTPQQLEQLRQLVELMGL